MGLFLFSCTSTPSKSGAMLTEPVLTATPAPNAVAAPAPAPTPAHAQNELKAAVASANLEKIRSASLDILLANPRDTAALNALATYYYNRNEPAAAALLLEKAIASNPNSPVAYNNLGLIALAKNEKTAGLEMFRRAMQIDAQYYPAAVNAAAVYAQEKDYNKVVFALEPAVKSGVADSAALNNYALALGHVGKAGEAAEIYEKILQKNPDQREALLNFAILLIEKQEKYQPGLDLLSRLKFVGGDNESRQVINELEVKAKAGLK